MRQASYLLLFFAISAWGQLTDPHQGVTTSQIVNLKTTEPDPVLFQLPAGYTVVDETAPTFTIRY